MQMRIIIKDAERKKFQVHSLKLGNSQNYVRLVRKHQQNVETAPTTLQYCKVETLRITF